MSNKKELIEMISKDKQLKDMSKAKIEMMVNLTLDGIKAVVKKTGGLQLVGFGTFKVKKTKARTGRNPQTGKALKIAAGKKVSFKAGQEFKKMVK